MPTKFPLTANINTNNDFGLLHSDTNYTVVLGVSNTSLAVPLASDLGGSNTATNNFLIAVITHTASEDIWFSMNAPATVPSGSGAFAANSSMLLPQEAFGVKVKSGDTMNFLTAGSTVNLSASFFWL